MMDKEIGGSCLCGRVRFVVHGPFERFRFCYCSRCRKVTGSAHASVLFTSAENIRWLSGEDAVKRFELETTKYFARAFCSECGSALPWISRRDGSIVIPAGALDDDPEVRPQHRIFCADEAEWCRDVASIPRCDGTPD